MNQGINRAAAPLLSIIVCTYSRNKDICRAVQSFRLLKDMSVEVIVGDDGSPVPVEPEVRQAIGPDYPYPVTFFRADVNQGLITTRNRMAELATGRYVLSVDDDAYLIDAKSVQRAIEILEQDPEVADVAFAQVNPDGSFILPYQPGLDLEKPTVVPCFFGYGHVFRRAVFESHGGYRGFFRFNLEEPEICKRLLDSGFKVVFEPRARLVHTYSQINRVSDERDYLLLRNSIYDSMMNEPLPYMALKIAYKVYSCGIHHRQRITRCIGDIRRHWHLLWPARKPLRWATYRKWWALRKLHEPYVGPALSK